MGEVERMIRPGLTLLQIDEFIEKRIVQCGGLPAFKGYKDYPNASCLSLNEVAVHGIPNDTVLKLDDCLDVDFGVAVDGWNVDAAQTLFIYGDRCINEPKLVTDTRRMCHAIIDAIRPGVSVAKLADVGQKFANDFGLRVMTQYCGHGIGRAVHEDPCIHHSYPDGLQPFAQDALRSIYEKSVLEAGQVVCIEPVCTLGSTNVRELDDGWTHVSADNSLVSHHEHTVLVTDSGHEILC